MRWRREKSIQAYARAVRQGSGGGCLRHYRLFQKSSTARDFSFEAKEGKIMEYTQGRLGRVFLLRFKDDDILLDELVALAKKEKIRCATFVFLGALKKGHLVTGPKKPVIPPQANWVTFKDGWEVMGQGTIFSNRSGPQVHVHATMGKKNKMLTGCVRKDSKVFLVLEAVVFELAGIKAAKEIDPKTGLNLLKIL